MDQKIQDLFELSKNGTKEERYNALIELNSTLEQPVDWAYDVWDDLIELLSDKDGHQRSRAAQYLSRLAAYSDPEDRILKDFDALWQVTFDEKFVTARHTIQTLWRVGLGSDAAKNLFLEHVIDRFNDGDKEKNYTLIRNDFLQGMRNLYDETHDEVIKTQALELIDSVDDPKYQKKYAKIWK